MFSDHTDLRPTVLALLGLTDDYVSDGRVLMEFVAPELVPDRHQYVNLAQVYKQINAPLGKLGPRQSHLCQSLDHERVEQRRDVQRLSESDRRHCIDAQ